MSAGAPFFLAADWPAPHAVHGGATRRHGLGVSPPPFDTLNLGGHRLAQGDTAANVRANREALRVALGLPAEPRWLRQVHGRRVLDADVGAVDGTPVPAGGDEPEADAVVTRRSGVVLAVLHADCLPLLLCSDDGAVLGAAHAGWRGLAAGVIEASVAAMAVPGERLLAWLGPAAGPENYEVGEEVHAAFLDAALAPAVRREREAALVASRPGHWRLDLYALARQRLAALGVTRVHGGGRCTIGEPDAFFSHRRDGRSGRMASLLWRSP